MIYLIGGAPESGKIILAQRLVQKTGIPVVPTDTLTAAVIAATEHTKVRSKWPPTKELIEHAILCNQDFIIMGTHFPPRDLNTLKGTKIWKHIKIVYLVKKTNPFFGWMHPTMFHRIFPSVKKGSKGLLSSERKIQKYSKMIMREAKKYGFKVVNTRHNSEKKLEEAQKYLTSSV